MMSTCVVEWLILHGDHCIISHKLSGKPHVVCVCVYVKAIDGVIMLVLDQNSLPKI